MEQWDKEKQIHSSSLQEPEYPADQGHQHSSCSRLWTETCTSKAHGFLSLQSQNERLKFASGVLDIGALSPSLHNSSDPTIPWFWSTQTWTSHTPTFPAYHGISWPLHSCEPINKHPCIAQSCHHRQRNNDFDLSSVSAPCGQNPPNSEPCQVRNPRNTVSKLLARATLWTQWVKPHKGQLNILNPNYPNKKITSVVYPCHNRTQKCASCDTDSTLNDIWPFH